MTAEAEWTIRHDEDDDTWEVWHGEDVQVQWLDSKADAEAELRTVKAEAEAESLREEISDLVADLDGQHLAKLRLILSILRKV